MKMYFMMLMEMHIRGLLSILKKVLRIVLLSFYTLVSYCEFLSIQAEEARDWNRQKDLML